MNEKDKIISKIKKLLNLADPTKNQSENEINNALTAAKKYMSKHGLSIEELKQHSDNSSLVTIQSELKVNRNWQRILGIAINKICDVRSFSQSSTLFFLGFKDDIILAKQLYYYLRCSLYALSVQQFKNTLLRNSYLLGASQRILLRAEEESKKETKENIKYGSLVIVKKSEIDNWINKNMKNTKTKSINSNPKNNFAFQMGFNDAANISLNNKKEIEQE